MSTGIRGERVFRKNQDILMRTVAGETILVPIRGRIADMQRIFTLNPVGAFIWSQINGELTAADIDARIQEEFDVCAEESRTDLEDFLDRLRNAGLIEEVK